MPNIKSAKKRMRSNAKKAEVNTLITSSMKTAIKKFEKTVKEGNKEEASNKLNIAIQESIKLVLVEKSTKIKQLD